MKTIKNMERPVDWPQCSHHKLTMRGHQSSITYCRRRKWRGSSKSPWNSQPNTKNNTKVTHHLIWWRTNLVLAIPRLPISSLILAWLSSKIMKCSRTMRAVTISKRFQTQNNRIVSIRYPSLALRMPILRNQMSLPQPPFKVMKWSC